MLHIENALSHLSWVPCVHSTKRTVLFSPLDSFKERRISHDPFPFIQCHRPHPIPSLGKLWWCFWLCPNFRIVTKTIFGLLEVYFLCFHWNFVASCLFIRYLSVISFVLARDSWFIFISASSFIGNYCSAFYFYSRQHYSPVISHLPYHFSYSHLQQ